MTAFYSHPSSPARRLKSHTFSVVVAVQDPDITVDTRHYVPARGLRPDQFRCFSGPTTSADYPSVSSRRQFLVPVTVSIPLPPGTVLPNGFTFAVHSSKTLSSMDSMMMSMDSQGYHHIELPNVNRVNYTTAGQRFLWSNNMGPGSTMPNYMLYFSLPGNDARVSRTYLRFVRLLIITVFNPYFISHPDSLSRALLCLCLSLCQQRVRHRVARVRVHNARPSSLQRRVRRLVRPLRRVKHARYGDADGPQVGYQGPWHIECGPWCYRAPLAGSYGSIRHLARSYLRLQRLDCVHPHICVLPTDHVQCIASAPGHS
jgi:hypothetical protein